MIEFAHDEMSPSLGVYETNGNNWAIPFEQDPVKRKATINHSFSDNRMDEITKSSSNKQEKDFLLRVILPGSGFVSRP